MVRTRCLVVNWATGLPMIRTSLIALSVVLSGSAFAQSPYTAFAFSSTRSQFSPVILRTFSGVVILFSAVTSSP